jgi:hypothetical protein
MLTTLSTPLLLVLAGVVGLLLGLLVSTIFRNDPKPSGEGPQLPKKFADQGYDEATRLYYSPATKKAITELDGDFYADYATLTPEQKKRVLRILQAWQEWSGGQPAPTAVSVAAPVQSTAAAPTVAAIPATMPKLPTTPVSAPAKPGSVAQPQAAAKQEPKSIVEQINDILEEMLVNSPEKARGIHLMDNGHEGVLVWVGIEKFNGVDEVPYPEVQDLIRTAVAKWEEETEAHNRAMNENLTK